MIAPNRSAFAILRHLPLVGLAITATSLSACLREPLESRRSSAQGDPGAIAAPDTPVPPTREHGVLLAGKFDQVAKRVSGSVTLERTGEIYELVVRDVALSDPGPVHVYLVGLPQVRSSADLDGVDAKYDFGPLEETGSGAYVAVHRVKLPGKPNVDLRSVALLNPRFGVVLASSSLQEPK